MPWVYFCFGALFASLLWGFNETGEELAMLVLQRREGESLVLTTPEGKTVVVMVVLVDQGKVRLGFEADREVKIVRGELLKGRKCCEK